ncbi:hypothetical protein T05_331 [Trichinella murrelli]|uniref:Uncharacterized protein n=1 Tax=Trichinella murrelli TaxID=144512 RepID=A0A0V0T0S0_9BILA|nr:hypothetical protein T05_331 [Trichinella murrelli]
MVGINCPFRSSMRVKVAVFLCHLKNKSTSRITPKQLQMA